MYLYQITTSSFIGLVLRSALRKNGRMENYSIKKSGKKEGFPRQKMGTAPCPDQ